MNLYSSPALVLRRAPHLDNDVKLTLLLRELGKVLVVVRGGRRFGAKLGGLKEPFSESDCQVYLPPSGFQGRLISGKLLDSHQDLRHNLDYFCIACKGCEVIEAVVPYRAPCPDVYDILRLLLRSLGKKSNVSPHILWMIFVVQLLKSLGHGDISMGTDDHLNSKERIHLKSVLAAHSDFDANPPQLSFLSLRRCLAYLDGQLERHLPRKLKSDIRF